MDLELASPKRNGYHHIQEFHRIIMDIRFRQQTVIYHQNIFQEVEKMRYQQPQHPGKPV